MERSNLRNISELEVRKQNQMKIPNRFEALENLNDSDDINRACGNIKQNTKTPAIQSLCLYELKQYTLWYDDECCGFLDQRKQAKKQWLQNPNQARQII